MNDPAQTFLFLCGKKLTHESINVIIQFITLSTRTPHIAPLSLCSFPDLSVVNQFQPYIKRIDPLRTIAYLYFSEYNSNKNAIPLRYKHYLIATFLGLISINIFSQQVADTNFNPVIAKPEYPRGKGPVVAIDEGHNNFHTAGGRYLPFSRLLAADGYLVNGYTGEFTESQLKMVRILVIANALNEINIQNWYVPTPSAFTEAETETVRRWVENGGSLFLIADHMPFGRAAAGLASAFGFKFTNGFAMDSARPGNISFSRNDNTLTSCSITNGRDGNETVNKVVTFTGQAMRIPAEATSILNFDKRSTLLETDTAWVFDSTTKRTPINLWSQGAYMKYGKGRVVMFGEAAMFSAQLAGPNQIRVGMNSDYAEENYKLLLNIIHWLDGRMRD